MGTKYSVTGNSEKIAKIDDMLAQRIHEVEECRSGSRNIESYREEYFATLYRDIFDVNQ